MVSKDGGAKAFYTAVSGALPVRLKNNLKRALGAAKVLKRRS
jgi:hypothetical protein